MKRIYVEWLDDNGKLRNGNIVGVFTVKTFERGACSVNTDQVTFAEPREGRQ